MSRIPFPPMKYPLIAILRGLKPAETEAVVGALIETGFTAIEIPLNSPEPFQSIGIAANMAPEGCLIGAGTVLTVADVNRLDEVGGRLMVSPNVEPEVISTAAAKGMVTMPGVFTPTEALAAARAGATGLKFFPASVLGPAGIQAIRAVLPAELEIAGALSMVAEGTPVALVVSGGLGALYRQALAAAGLSPSVIDADDAVRRGLAGAARSLWPA